MTLVVLTSCPERRSLKEEGQDRDGFQEAPAAKAVGDQCEGAVGRVSGPV